MEMVRSVIIATALISTVIILLLVIVIPPELPRVAEEDVGEVTPGIKVIEDESPLFYWHGLDLSVGESYSFRSTFPNQIGDYTIDVLGIVGDNYTVHVYGSLNDSFDKTVSIPKDSFFISMMKSDEELMFVGIINTLFLSQPMIDAFAKLNLSVGSAYISRFSSNSNLTVTGFVNVFGFDCYVVESYSLGTKEFEYCLSPDIGLPVRVRHFSPIGSGIDYVISITNYELINS